MAGPKAGKAAQSPRIVKTVGVYEKPGPNDQRQAGGKLPRSALFAGAIALAAAVSAAAFYFH
jgi:hypothetical protein